jgi:dienelactone hydrolase
MIELQTVSLEHAGKTLTGYAAIPAGDGPFPAVLVMHNAMGLGAHVQQSAQKLAALGYAAIATDMYGVEIARADQSAAGASMQALMATPGLLRARCVAWFEAVAAMPQVDVSRIAAIGYCMGGQCVLELARSGADVKAVVSFHGLLTTDAPAQPGAIKGEVAAYCGALDPFAPLDHIEGLRTELAAAGVSYHITTFGKVAHAFTDVDAADLKMPGIEYNALADRVSWAGTIALLEAILLG